MQFVAAQTSVPVPKVHYTFERKGRGYIVMERFRGQTIGSALDSLSEPAKQSIFSELRAAMDQLRSLEPPSMAVQSCVGGSLQDFRIAHARHKRFGPFDSVAEFHLWLRMYHQLPMTSIHWSDMEERAIEKMIKTQDRGYWPPPVFTHADLNLSNIIVRDGRLVGIIDWAFSGWYPSYWEYTAACCTAATTEWKNHLGVFLDPWPEELEMEITRNGYWGEV
jgi:aminoglycoside phosphotransferase (APT) family kinase protein